MKTLLLSLALVASATTTGVLANSPTGWTSRASLGASGEEANRFSAAASISADGRYVAFQSGASNLVMGDTNAVNDIFVRDRKTGLTELVSYGSAGQANGNSGFPFISPDGRFVVFESWATNLVAGDNNGFSDVFLHDRGSGTTELISTNSLGEQGTDGPSGEDWPTSVSADGRFVAFSSRASNLASPDADTLRDTFVKDRLTGQTDMVSVDSIGVPLTGSHSSPNISDDGRWVVFQSSQGSESSIHVRDRTDGLTGYVGAGAFPGISPDGRFIAYTRRAPGSNFCASSLCDVVLLFDQVENSTEVISADSGRKSVSFSNQRTVSADGRQVVFTSYSDELVPGDLNGFADVFVYDRHHKTTRLVSIGKFAESGNGPSVGVSLSADGRTVAFLSFARNLVEGDNNNASDVFVHDQKLRWRR